MRAAVATVVSALLVGCSSGPERACAVDAGTDAALVPDVDPGCRHLTPEDLVHRPVESEPLRAVHLSIQGAVAHADFVGYFAASECESLVRFRIGLDDGVVTLTDHACVDDEIERLARWALCRVDPGADLEVHALGRGVVPPDHWLAGPLIRVVRHSTGEILFTFGQGMVKWDGWPAGTFERDHVFLAPERASAPRCCPTDSCIVTTCGYDELYPGCRWTNEISTTDGFCYARLVD